MESSQPENGLAMKEKMAAENSVMPDIESKVCCNGTTTVNDAVCDGEVSRPSSEPDGDIFKDSSPPPLSPVSLPTDDAAIDTLENGFEKTSDPSTSGSLKAYVGKIQNNPEDKSHNSEKMECSSGADAVTENHVIDDVAHTLSNDKGEEEKEALETSEKNSNLDADSSREDTDNCNGISKLSDATDPDIPVLEKSCVDGEPGNTDGQRETSNFDALSKSTEDPSIRENSIAAQEEVVKDKVEIEKASEDSEFQTNGDKEPAKPDPGHEKPQSIPPQIFEDITEDEYSEDEEIENIELELDDLIDPADVSKSHASSDNQKSDSPTPNEDVEMVDETDLEMAHETGSNGDTGKNNSQDDAKLGQIEEKKLFGTSQVENDQTDIIKVLGGSILSSEETSGNLNDIQRPESCNTVIANNKIEKRDDEDVNMSKQPALEISKAAGEDKCASAPVKKQKFTARKSGKPVSQTEISMLKTINLHPIKNITMNVSDIEGALDFPLKETDSSKSSKLSETSYHSDTALHQSDGNSGSGSGKTSLGGKKKRRKNTYDFPGCKKKPKKARLDELESIGSSAESVSLSDGDFQDLDSSKEQTYLLKGSSSKGSKIESALDILTKNSHLGFTKKLKNPLLPSSSSVSSSSTSSASSTTSSLLASRLNKGKGNSKMKTVLDMLHERNRQKAEEKKATSSTTTTTVSVTSSATTTTTTILVSPPPNTPIVEGVKRKGTPRKRREEVICLSDSDESDGKKNLVVAGKRKRDSLDNSTSLSSVPVSSPTAPPPSGKPRFSVPTTQSPVVMVVAQHSAAPGLRSLLPRHALVSPSSMASSKMVQPTGSLFSSFPLISTLPAGAKAISVGNLPPGVTAVPITSLPAGTQQGMTFFTTVPGGGGVPIPISGANLVNITPPKSQVNNTTPSKSVKIPSTSSQSPSLSKTTNASPAQNNSDSLRALLVGKPYTFNRVSSATPQLSTAPMLFQMVTTSGGNLVPVPTQPLTLAPSSMIPGMLKPAAAVPSAKSSYSLIKPHPPHVPNGVSCLTPPKTPDTDSSSEVAVAASLSRPVAGQVEDSEVIPLCCCKINGASFNKLFSGVTYCQALDTVDSKVLGCCNKVTNPQLVRPGVKIPFMAVCEVHRKRLKLHQCCPGCGHFCTQGKFQQCRKEGKSSVHNFHKQCMFYRGGKYYCPHCGEETSRCEVELKMNEEKPEEGKVVASRVSRKDSDKKTAHMGSKDFVKSRSTNESKEKTLTLSNNKVINIGSLPLGPEHQILTRLCRCTGEDRPKKYRTLPKDLYSPASEGDIEKVFYLLMDGMDPNVRYENYEDQTAVHAAAVSGSVGTVFILQQFGAEIHAQDKNLRTPMMCAAENGHLKVVQFLIKSGARVEDRGEDGMTSLHYAAKSGYIDIIQHILETGKLDVNVQDDGGWTAITWATENQLLDAVKYLIKQGGDPNKKDNEENTGLHWAAFAGSLEIAEIYLDIGCELDSPNEHGDRPLHIAARQDHYDIVVLLLARGADVDTKNNKDETPVESCTNKNGQVWMALKVNQQLRSFAARKLIQPERLLERDITMGREKNPIACVNSEDKEPCPTDFLYVVENVETSPLNINYVITSLQSCRCKDDCSSMYCVCARSSIKCWYDKMGRLLEEVNLLEPPLVFECNRACRCWVNCNNRVVQNGITCRLQLFRTNGRGWGVRTLMDIPKGTFVCEYIGELISDSEADRREDDSYLFDLDNKDGDTYCIDARKYGNISRFINHLCEPNLIPVKVFVEHQDLRFPRICLFSSKEIKAYEELGFDYGEKFWMIKWKHFTCACNSNKCKYSSDTIKKTLADYKLRYPDEQVDT